MKEFQKRKDRGKTITVERYAFELGIDHNCARIAHDQKVATGHTEEAKIGP